LVNFNWIITIWADLHVPSKLIPLWLYFTSSCSKLVCRYFSWPPGALWSQHASSQTV